MFPRIIIAILLFFGWNTRMLALSDTKIDLNDRPLATKTSQQLSGLWRIYPGVFVDPNHPDLLLEENYQTLNVPGEDWILKAPQKFGTLALALENLPDDRTVILFDQFFGSHRSYFVWQTEEGWHSTFLASSGKVARSAAESIFQGRKVMGRLPKHVKSGWLIVHLSNYYSPGLMASAPSIGLYPAYAKAELILKRWEAFFVLGSFFLLAVTNFALFLQRREDLASLNMAALSVTLFLRFFSTEGLWGELFTPTQNLWVLNMVAMSLCNMYPGYFIVAFLRQSFPDFFPRKVLLGFGASMLILTLWILWEIPHFSQWPQFASYLIFLFMIPYTLVQTARAALAKQRGAGLSTLGTLFMSIGIVNDTLIVFHAYDFIYIGHYGMLAYVFTQSLVVGKNFASAFHTADRLSRELKKEVERQTRDAKAILHHVHQGLLTLNSDGSINDDYSTYLRDIVETAEPTGLNIREVLLQRSDLNNEQKADIFSILLTTVGEDAIAFEMNSSNLPKQLIFDKRKILELEWQPVIHEKEQKITKIILTINDVTTVRELEKKNREQSHEMDLIARLLEISPEKFLALYRSSKDMLDESNRLIVSNNHFEPEVLRLLFVNMHTIKGAARTYGMKDLTALAHDTEQYYAQVQKGDAPWDQTLSEQMVGAVADSLNNYYAINRYKLRREPDENLIRVDLKMIRDNILELQKIQGSDLNPMLIPFVNKARSTFFSIYYTDSHIIFEELTNKLPSLARDLGKQPPRIIVEGKGIGLTVDACETLRRSFVHLLRNAMDHGIEAGPDRMEKGKNPSGTITIRQIPGALGELNILMEDDGAGLQMQRIRAKALQLGILQAHEKIDAETLAQMIFRTGFSTAHAVSEISGRGVGLDAVKHTLEEAGGSVRIELLSANSKSESQAFRFHLTLPKDLWVFIEHEESRSA